MKEYMKNVPTESAEFIFTDDQKRAMKILCLTHHATEKQLLTIMSDREYRALREKGFLEREKPTKFENKFQTTLGISKKGQDEAKSQKISKVFYGSKAVRHNLYMTDHLIPKNWEVLNSVSTEGQSKYEMKDWIGSKDNFEKGGLETMKKKGQISVPDLTYRENGQLIYFEVSNDYKREKIESKFRYQEMREAKMIFKEIGKRNLLKIEKFGEDWWREKN